MNVEAKTKVIGDHTYVCTPVNAEVAIAVGVRLFQAAGPSLADMLAGLDQKAKKKNLLDVDTKILANAIKTLAITLKQDDLTYVMDNVMGPHVTCDGKPLTKEFRQEFFRGKVHELLKVLAFVLGVNFSGFLSDWGPLSKGVSV